VVVEVRLAHPGGAVAVPPGGEVKSISPAAIELEFSVRDTGIGIPADKLQMIFDPFSQVDGSTTRKYGGTGLGLSICSRLVEMMGGRLGVESVPEQGSRFFFTVKLGVASDRVPSAVEPERVRGLSVLVVDDNATNRQILEQILTHWQMRPTSVDGAPAALRALEEACTAGKPFALILLDAHMPEMDGFMLAERIRDRPELGGGRIMMLSSAGPPGAAVRGQSLGISSYLTKPVTQTELWKAILQALVAAPPGTARPVEKETRKLDAAPGRREAALAGQKRPLRILLAEDNLFNQKLAIGLLEKEGHRIVVANNGVEALAILERETFDLVMMDVQMPEMDGLAATRVLRRREAEQGRHTPVLAMTAYAMKGDRERCLAAGMDGYVSKPIRARELYDAIAAAVDAPALSPPAPSLLAPGECPDWGRALNQVAGDRKLLRELVRLFLHECPGWLAQMRRGACCGDAATMRTAAHNLKSCLGNFAVQAAFDAALNVEKLGREGKLDGAEEACRAVEQAIDRLRPALLAFAESG
jgi:CheY-like chemotaxis protein/HPt (histidine-containing phosphotransfer) domain-containing protein